MSAPLSVDALKNKYKIQYILFCVTDASNVLQRFEIILTDILVEAYVYYSKPNDFIISVTVSNSAQSHKIWNPIKVPDIKELFYVSTKFSFYLLL